jgi:membrane-bound ClpP family serine protease
MEERQIGTLALTSLWLTIAGGLLSLVSLALASSFLAVVGVVLFVVGVILFFVAAMRDSRRDDVGLGLAIRRSAGTSIRFVFKLMP